MKRVTTGREETQGLQGVSVHAGFPNPAADSLLQTPDFNQLLIRHPAATYCMRIHGHAWEDRGIYDGDIIVIDRVVAARSLDLVVWWQDDSFVIGKQREMKENGRWGVVTAIIHQYKN